VQPSQAEIFPRRANKTPEGLAEMAAFLMAASDAAEPGRIHVAIESHTGR
jgi:hypothetical protein